MTTESKDRLVLAVLAEYATASPDPSTQNAACIYDPHTPGGTLEPQVNRFPRGITDTTEKWQRPGKYDRVVHAEVAAILTAARIGFPTKGRWLYALWAACGPCASIIVEAGITRVVTLESSDPERNSAHGHWAESIRTGYDTMREAGVEIAFYPSPVAPNISLLRNGQEFRP